MGDEPGRRTGALATASQVPHRAAEAEDGEVLVVDGVVEVIQRLDAPILGVEDLGVRAELLAVAVGDDVDVLLGLDDRQLGDRDAPPGLQQVEPSGADLERAEKRMIGFFGRYLK